MHFTGTPARADARMFSNMTGAVVGEAVKRRSYMQVCVRYTLSTTVNAQYTRKQAKRILAMCWISAAKLDCMVVANGANEVVG